MTAVEALQDKLSAMHRRAQAAESRLQRVRDQATWEGFVMGKGPSFLDEDCRREQRESAQDALVAGARADAYAAGFAAGFADGAIAGAEEVRACGSCRYHLGMYGGWCGEHGEEAEPGGWCDEWRER